jgi:hypothetical protein
VPAEGLHVATGMRWPLGLPGPVRVEFEKGGVEMSGRDPHHCGPEPRTWKRSSLILLIMGGVGLAVAAVSCGVGLVQRRRVMAQQVQTVEPVPPQSFT